VVVAGNILMLVTVHYMSDCGIWRGRYVMLHITLLFDIVTLRFCEHPFGYVNYSYYLILRVNILCSDKDIFVSIL